MKSAKADSLSYIEIVMINTVVCNQCHTDKRVISTSTWSNEKLFNLDCGHKMNNSEVEESKVLADDLLFQQLMPFQQTGTQFGEDSGFNCLVGDDMRLGKTPQSLAMIRRNWKKLTPVLIIVKARTRFTWADECLYWLNEPIKPTEKWGRRYKVTHDPNRIPWILDSRYDPMPGMNVYIISMDSLRTMHHKIREKLGIKTVIVDESHNFKTWDSQRTKALHEFCKDANIKYRICLSGTPINNSTLEYFPTLHLLRPDLFPSQKKFANDWLSVDWSTGKFTGIKPYRQKEFFDLTRSFIIRRTKDEVLKERPSFTRIPEILEIEDSNFIKVYKKGQKELQDFMTASLGRGHDTISVIALLSKLREACGLAKVPSVVEAAEEFFENERDVPKLLIGVHHHSVGNALKLALKKYGAEYLIGGISDYDQQVMENKFRNDPNCKILIASTLAAGEGLDFQFAHTVFQVERQWNVYKEKQFEDRINGMIQKNPMTAVYFMVKNSIDEWFHNLVMTKMQWTESALDEKYFETHGTGDAESGSVNFWELADMCLRKIK